MKGLKNLRYLDLSMNGLEKLPEVVTSLISLQELYLNDTMMEFLPANFGRLVNLRILELRENPLLTLPKSISRLTALQRLDIGQNEFSELVSQSPSMSGAGTRPLHEVVICFLSFLLPPSPLLLCAEVGDCGQRKLFNIYNGKQANGSEFDGQKGLNAKVVAPLLSTLVNQRLRENPVYLSVVSGRPFGRPTV